MSLRNLTHPLVFCLITVFSFPGMARNHVVTIFGGDVHLRGALSEGACVVSAGSQDMHVDMGQYRSDEFSTVGSESSLHVPFVIHLTDCNPALADRVGLSFSGVTDPKEPDAFLVTSDNGVPLGVSGAQGFSGIGLIISDAQGKQVMPDALPSDFIHLRASDVSIPFLAHYRKTSRTVYPGDLHSEVDFRIVYP